MTKIDFNDILDFSLRWSEVDEIERLLTLRRNLMAEFKRDFKDFNEFRFQAQRLNFWYPSMWILEEAKGISPQGEQYQFATAWYTLTKKGMEISSLIEHFKNSKWDFPSFKKTGKETGWWMESMEILNNEN